MTRLARIVVAFVVCVAALSCKKEPTYQGKPLSTWLRLAEDRDLATQREAILALKTMTADDRAREVVVEKGLRFHDKDVRLECALTMSSWPGYGAQVLDSAASVAEDGLRELPLYTVGHSDALRIQLILIGIATHQNATPAEWKAFRMRIIAAKAKNPIYDAEGYDSILEDIPTTSPEQRDGVTSQ